MEISCQSCSKEILLKQEYRYHAGFGGVGFLYCNKCSNTLIFSVYDSVYTSLIPDKGPWDLPEEKKKIIEQKLKSCSCGGQFLFKNKPLCPHCGVSIASTHDGRIYYLELGNLQDGNKTKIWND